MKVQAVKTRLVTSKSCTLEELLDESLQELTEKSVVAIASKVVAMCEGRVVPVSSVDKDELVAQEAQLYIPSTMNRYGVTLSKARNTLVVAAGVDESNSGDNYVLWPSDPQVAANEVRAYLRKRFNLQEVGVIITDSVTRPLQWGTIGVALAYSGFEPLHSYVGEEDLFGRKFVFQNNSIQNGLAAAAVVIGGEGTEQTPVVVLSELDFVRFVDYNPTEEELASLVIDFEDDVWGIMLKSMPWRKGRAKS